MNTIGRFFALFILMNLFSCPAFSERLSSFSDDLKSDTVLGPFIQGLYLDLLGRNPDPKNFNKIIEKVYADILDRSGDQEPLYRTQVVSGIQSSPEYRYVADLNLNKGVIENNSIARETIVQLGSGGVLDGLTYQQVLNGGFSAKDVLSNAGGGTGREALRNLVSNVTSGSGAGSSIAERIGSNVGGGTSGGVGGGTVISNVVSNVSNNTGGASGDGVGGSGGGSSIIDKITNKFGK